MGVRFLSLPPIAQPRGVMKRGTLLRSKSGFDSRRGFSIRGRGETGSRDARIVQSRGRHPAAPPLTGTILKDIRVRIFFAGSSPRSLPSPGRGPGEGGGRRVSGCETEETRCWIVDPVEAGSSPTPAAFAFVVKWQSPPASNGKFRVQLLARAPIPGGVTVACLSYKEKDLVRFKAGEPFSGLSVTEAYSPRTGEAGVRRTDGLRLPQPRPYRRCSPTAEAPRSERG